MSLTVPALSVPLTVVAGTWSGYPPVLKQSDRRDAVYQLKYGMSDKQRFEALLGGHAAAVLVTIQALTIWRETYQDQDLVAFHVFGRSNCADVEDWLMIRKGLNLGDSLRWAVPGEGLERKVAERLEPGSGGRLRTFASRGDCVEAVLSGDADALMINRDFARQIVAERVTDGVHWLPLPDEIWSDLWVLGVAPRAWLNARKEPYGALVTQLAHDAHVVEGIEGNRYLFPNLVDSGEMLMGADLTGAWKRWGGARDDSWRHTGVLDHALSALK